MQAFRPEKIAGSGLQDGMAESRDIRHFLEPHVCAMATQLSGIEIMLDVAIKHMGEGA